MGQEKGMDADASSLQELNTKFEVFTQEVLARLDSIKAEVAKLSENQRHKRSQEAERKRAQRQRDREERLKGFLPLPKSDIWKRDDRIKLKYLQPT